MGWNLCLCFCCKANKVRKVILGQTLDLVNVYKCFTRALPLRSWRLPEQYIRLLLANTQQEAYARARKRPCFPIGRPSQFGEHHAHRSSRAPKITNV